MASAFSRKVQLTREEFMRELRGAIGNLKYSTEGNDIVIGDGGKLVRITLTDLGIEDLGSLHLPMQRVDFNFENMNGTEADTFMTVWDGHKLRMGG